MKKLVLVSVVMCMLASVAACGAAVLEHRRAEANEALFNMAVADNAALQQKLEEVRAAAAPTWQPWRAMRAGARVREALK